MWHRHRDQAVLGPSGPVVQMPLSRSSGVPDPPIACSSWTAVIFTQPALALATGTGNRHWEPALGTGPRCAVRYEAYHYVASGH